MDSFIKLPRDLSRDEENISPINGIQPESPTAISYQLSAKSYQPKAKS
jgi:hypothetical protein